MQTEEDIFEEIASDIISSNISKKMKLKTLLKKFGYERRTEENAKRITEGLAIRKIFINPSIMKLGEHWTLKSDDRIKLFHKIEDDLIENKIDISNNKDWNDDGWFDDILNKEFRTEREVETKFIIPLLCKLGYSENDRYDGMSIKAFHGSKSSNLEVDFALFDYNNEDLQNQVLLVVEAKKEERLIKNVEIEKAQKQVKSYAIWLSCHFGIVTDSRKIQILNLFPSINGIEILFECNIDELKPKFNELFRLVGKKNLVNYYSSFINK